MILAKHRFVAHALRIEPDGYKKYGQAAGDRMDQGKGALRIEFGLLRSAEGEGKRLAVFIGFTAPDIHGDQFGRERDLRCEANRQGLIYIRLKISNG